MRLLVLDNQTVDLIEVQQRLLGNYSHLLIDMCGITDRLVPWRSLSLLAKSSRRSLDRDAVLRQQQGHVSM